MIIKIIKNIRILLNAKWIFCLPIKKKILILGTQKSDIFNKILNKKTLSFLDIKNKEINILIYFRTLIKFDFKRFMYNYFIEYIKVVNPKILIISGETYIFFWNLKKYFPQKKIILIQTTIRTFYDKDLLVELKKMNLNKKFNIDCTFVWGDSMIPLYKKYIDSKFIANGNLTNNFVQINKNYKKNFNFGLISQVFNYENRKLLKYNNKNDKVLLSDVIHKSTKNILKFFSKYNNEKEKELTIIPRSNYGSKQFAYEENFYYKVLKNSNIKYQFIKKSNTYDSYKILNKFNIIFGLTSTLLYETMSRGNKAAFFNYFQNYGLQGYDFSYPLKKKESKISTSKMNQNNFDRIIDYLIKIKKNDWVNENKFFFKKILHFDERNKKMKKIILKIQDK